MSLRTLISASLENFAFRVCQRIAKLHEQLGDDVPSREQLKGISAGFSVDFEALVFASQLLKQQGNAQLQRQFLANLDQIWNGTVR